MTLVIITSHFLTCLSSGRCVDNGLLQFPTNKTHATDTIKTQIRVGDVFWTILISRYRGIKVSVLVVTSAFLIAVSRWLNRNKRQTSIPIIPPPRLIHTLHTENPCFRHPKQIITCRSFKTQWYVVSWWFNGVKQVWNVFPVFNGSDVKIYSAFIIILNIWREKTLSYLRDFWSCPQGTALLFSLVSLSSAVSHLGPPAEIDIFRFKYLQWISVVDML